MITNTFTSPAARRGGILQGCLIALAIAAVLAIIAGVIIWMNARSWMASGFQAAVQPMVQSSGLPADQQKKITDRVTQLTDDFRTGKIDFPQLAQVLQTLTEGSLMPTLILHASTKAKLAGSGLTDEDKAAGQRTIERLTRAVSEQKLGLAGVREILSPMMEPSANLNEWRMKATVTDADLRAFLTKAKDQADLAKIPDEPFTLDVAAELDKALGNAGVIQDPAPR